MSRIEFERTMNDQLFSHIEDEVADDDPDVLALQKATADYYERRWRSRTNDLQGSWWLAAGLYLILASGGFVIL